VLALALFAAALFPASSPAPAVFGPVATLYWTGGEANGSIGWGSIYGKLVVSGVMYSGEGFPVDLTLDPPTKDIFWTGRTEAGVGAVRTGPLGSPNVASTLYESPSDGSLPSSLTIDRQGERLFWAQEPAGGGAWTIQTGAVDGSGASELTEVTGGPPRALRLDLSTLYWANGGKIESATISEPDIHTEVRSTPGEVRALALLHGTNLGSGRLFWIAQEGSDLTVYAGNVRGTDIQPLFEEKASALGGLMVWGETLYWTVDSAAGPGTVMLGDISGISSRVFEAGLGARSLALLTAPELLDKPWIRGANGQFGQSKVGQQLTCVAGNWASDEPEHSYYRSPGTVSWIWTHVDANGHEVIVGKDQTLTPEETGSYRCGVKGSNAFGSTGNIGSAAFHVDPATTPPPTVIREPVPVPQPPSAAPQTAPPPSNHFDSLVPRLDPATGTATLRLQVPGPGALSLSGKRVRAAHVRVGAAGVATLKVRPKPATRRQLVRHGNAQVKLVIRFVPDGGSPRAVARTITLRLN
jgi:hypothetical protein